jgi:hypothetical protein
VKKSYSKKTLIIILSIFVFLSIGSIIPMHKSDALDVSKGFFGNNISIYGEKMGGNNEIEVVFTLKINKNNINSILPKSEFPDCAAKNKDKLNKYDNLYTQIYFDIYKININNNEYYLMYTNTYGYNDIYFDQFNKEFSNFDYDYNILCSWANAYHDGNFHGIHEFMYNKILDDPMYLNLLYEQKQILKNYNNQQIFNYSQSMILKPKINFSDLKGVTQERINDINWLSQTGITIGSDCKNNKKCYKPNDKVNRGAMIEFLYNLAQKPSIGVYTYNSYDEHINKLSKLNNKGRLNAIRWFVDKGLISTKNFGEQKIFESVKPNKYSMWCHNFNYNMSSNHIYILGGPENNLHCLFQIWTPNLDIKNSMTRGAMAEFLYRIAGQPNAVNSSYYVNCELGGMLLMDYKAQTEKTYEDYCEEQIKIDNTVTNIKIDIIEDSLKPYPDPSTLADYENKYINDKDVMALKTNNPTRYYCILWMAKMGITLGSNPAGTLYNPKGTVTRGQMAQFLHRFYYVMRTGQAAPANGMIPNV